MLYRKDCWQVQLFIFGPNTIIPPHIHPNVDSFEVYVSGDIEFKVDGKAVLELDEHEAAEGQYAKLQGRSVRVYPTSWHSAISGPKGGSFLSIQQWLKGEPTNVGDDWKGLPQETRRNFAITNE